jgi:hypothetical protein
MSRTSWPAGAGVALGIALVLYGASPVTARQAPAAGAAVDVNTNAMNCWWATDRNAVRIGEPFGLTLTCRVLETAQASVVPNVSEIEPTSIQLTPFDVLGGTRHEDIVTPPWRYLQFVYTVRLLGEEFFGRDLAIPPTNVTFRIRTGGADAAEGVEHTYVLPSIPMRILSLLPAQAADIRDPSANTFGDIEARRFRSTVALVAAVILLGFAAVLLVIAAARAIERFRKRGPLVERKIPVRAVLGGCLRELDRVRAEALREGWTPGLAARALAPFRVGAAIALSQPVAQTIVPGDTPVRDGQVAVGYGMLRRRHALLSAPMTADAIDRLQASGKGSGHGSGNGSRPMRVNQEHLDQIREALAGLNAVRYGRPAGGAAADLDLMVDQGTSALRRLRASRIPGIGAWRR